MVIKQSTNSRGVCIVAPSCWDHLWRRQRPRLTPNASCVDQDSAEVMVTQQLTALQDSEASYEVYFLKIKQPVLNGMLLFIFRCSCVSSAQPDSLHERSESGNILQAHTIHQHHQYAIYLSCKAWWTWGWNESCRNVSRIKLNCRPTLSSVRNSFISWISYFSGAEYILGAQSCSDDEQILSSFMQLVHSLPFSKE